MKKPGCLVALLLAPGLLVVLVLAVLVIAPLRSAPKAVPIPNLRPTVAEADNAWPLLREAGELVRWPEDDEFVDPALKHPARAEGPVRKLLADNQAALAKLDQALAREQLLVPRVGGYDDLFPYLAPWRRLARLEVLRGADRVLRGSLAAGTDDLASVVELGHRVQNCGGSLIHHLLGSAIKVIGYRGAMALPAGAPAGSNAVLWQDFSHRLEAFEDNRTGLRLALTEEYHVLERFARHPELWRDDPVMEGDFPVKAPWPLYSADRTVALASNHFHQMLAQCDQPFWNSKLVPPTFIEPPSKLGLETIRYYAYNPVGNILLAILLPTFGRMPERLASTDAYAAATRTHLALRRFWEEHGGLPSDLRELVPTYLKEASVDPFDGKPLRYDPARGLVYSLGPNVVDDGGREGKTRVDLDIVFPLAFVVRAEAEGPESP